jgi:cyclopropane-fatty-acyl-phospholipid synthase
MSEVALHHHHHHTTGGGTLGPERHAGALLSRLDHVGVPSEVVLPDGETIRCGDGVPAFRLRFHTDRALAHLDELSLGRAYVDGEVDLEGDPLAMLDVRDVLSAHRPLLQRLRFLWQLFVLSPTLVNRKAIVDHYQLGPEFYFTFLDRKYRFYSHCLFRTGADTLEDAAERKLEATWDALGLRPGMRLLDIGGGWGPVAQYCGSRGVHVTALTLAPDSRAHIRKLIDDRHLDAEVSLEDFLEHRPSRPYDAAVTYGAIEHLPYYRRFCARLWECLPEGGRVYLDGSASKQKFDVSAFTRRYTWHGPHTFLSLQDLVREFLFYGFNVRSVADETRDYELTMMEWARRFDAARDVIVSGWSEALWRSFRIFLWGGAHAYRTDRIQAYHDVAERGSDRGPRPGGLARTWAFVRGLA